jgi:transcription elongation GreA/GreB family factor
MSRAFVKEPDSGAPDLDLPERPVSEHPNYVTPAGLAELERRAGELQARRLELLALGEDALAGDELRHVDRDLKYFAARIESAIVVDPAAQPSGEVAFGAAVTVTGEGGERTFTIVGEDEADLASLKVSFVSPLAEALMGAGVGDRVLWRRPAGDLELTVTAIAYDGRSAG